MLAEQELILTVTATADYEIDADAMSKIYQAFFTAQKRRGLGLGLPICDRISKSHGGTFEFESRRTKA